MSESAEVELDIFSGRPNPTWRLPATDTALLRREIEALPEASPTSIANNLGYRGFIVRIPDDDETTLVIQSGTVRVTRADAISYFHDRESALERWLLNTGRQFLDGYLIALVEREIN